jgi:hypothetical protein
MESEGSRSPAMAGWPDKQKGAACRIEDTIFGNGHILGTKSNKGSADSELTP